jgi:6-pyruvoyltetrahydropterin/6-carboxytetrahydropterin synthase
MNNTPRALTVASATFEAARKVDLLPESHPSRRLHGHSFTATVFADLPEDFAPFQGGEVDALRERLEAAIAPLNYAYLNDLLDQPTDENIARWIHRALSIAGIERVAIQSTAQQGVDLDRHGHAHVWRRFRFQSAHRLPNVPSGHKCGRMHGHGFEAIIHANQDLGSKALSIDYDLLDEVWAPLHMGLNYQCLNDIEGLSNPTSENIAAWIWQRLKPALPELSWVTVFETGSCGANFDGRQYRIWKEFSFDSATRLKHAPQGSDRHRLHGHTYTLKLHLNAPLDQAMGWTVDFGDVKDVFSPIFKAIDHHAATDFPGLPDGDTASLAHWVFAQTKSTLPSLYRIDLHETPGTGCMLSGAASEPAMPI